MESKNETLERFKATLSITRIVGEGNRMRTDKLNFEFEDLEVSRYIIVVEKSNRINGVVEKFPVGKPISLITSGMPEELREELEDIVKLYCNQ
jgi:hypothetical protein